MRSGGAADGITLQPLHRHADARLILFVAGRYRERAICEGAIFSAGDIVVRPAYYAHDGCALTADARYVHLRPSPHRLRDFFCKYGWRAQRHRFRGDWNDLAANAADLDAADSILAANWETLPHSPDVKQSDLIAKTLAEASGPNISDIAEVHNLSPWDLTRRFARAFGMTPTRYRQHARAQHALRLLSNGSLSLSAVASHAGFADQSHLGRVLRTLTGCTPDQLRRRLGP
ncbi:MAG: helix-turn-helix transcriptional regulator [Hyphomonadaceae bacterium]|nr:helix-turn-helix transcriptional regulator [Hyphomonadaceae bacterium]